MPPTVSVIVNAYNGEAYLRQAIESVLAQTYADWELILWDDRSTDGTARLFADFGDTRLHYHLAKERTSLGQARRDATSQARGQWLAFLDQDDAWTPDKLASQLAIVSDDHREQIGMVYGRAVCFDASGRTFVHDHRHEFSPLPQGRILESLVRDSCFIAMSSILVRASAYRAVGGFSSDMRYAVDYDLFFKLARRYDVEALQRPCCWYRRHANNMSRHDAVAVHREIMALMAPLDGEVNEQLLRYRRRVHTALCGFEQCRCGQVARGLGTIVRGGSLWYLATRPVVRAHRLLRRCIRRSPWGDPGPPPSAPSYALA